MGLTTAVLHTAGAWAQLERRLRWWQVGCLGLIGLNALAWGVNIRLATQASIQPYAVVVDPGGMVLWHGPPGSYAKEELWTMAALQEWLEYVRERRGDATHMAERHLRARQVVDGTAAQQLAAYLKALAEDPQQAQNPMRVQIGQFRWQPPAGADYAVSWQERWTPTYGTQPYILEVSARLTVERRQRVTPFGQAQLTAGDLNANRWGVYVTSFSWMERWQETPHATTLARPAVEQ